MEKQLKKMFLTALVLVIGATLESYSIDYMNTHDDFILAISLLFSVGCVLAMIYAVYRIWFKKIEVTNNNNN